MISFFKRSSLWLYTAIAVSLLWFYWPILITKGAWLIGDHAEQHYPWQWYLAHMVKQGKITFWTDLIHSGFPLIAEGQIGLFYLPNLLFAALFPIEQGYSWNIMTHLLLSCLFMAAFQRSLGLDAKSSFIGTFVYAFGSTLGGAYYNVTCLKVMTWFPLALILLDRTLLRTLRWYWAAVGLGVLFALQILAGYLQFAVYAMLFTGIYGLCTMLVTWKLERKAALGVVVALILGGVLGIALSLPQLMLTKELAYLSNRAQTAQEFAYVGSYSPFTLICLFFPNLEGFFVSKLYLGVLPLYFILASFYGRKTSAWKISGLIALIGFLLALGQFSPLYVGIVKLLHFHSFRTPVKFIFFAGFFLSILCAFGAQNVFQKDFDGKAGRALKTFMIFGGSAVLGVFVAFMCFHGFEASLNRLGEKMLRMWFYGKAGHPYEWAHYQRKLSELITFAQTVLDPRNSAFYIPVAKISLTLIFAWAIARYRQNVLRIYFFGILLLIADLQLSYSDIRGDYQTYTDYYHPNPIAQFLQEKPKERSYFIYSSNPSSSPLPQAKNMIYGVRSANAYSPLVVQSYYEVLGSLGGINDSIAYQAIDDEFLKKRSVLLTMMGIRYLVSDHALDGVFQSPAIMNDAGWRVYELPSNPGRYFFVSRYEVFLQREHLLNRLHDQSFNPQEAVLIEREPPIKISALTSSSKISSVQVVSEDEGRLSLAVDTPIPQLLVLGQIYYPGWRAQLDGVHVEILRANYSFQAVAVPEGKHSIHLFYDPWHSLKKDRQ